MSVEPLERTDPEPRVVPGEVVGDPVDEAPASAGPDGERGDDVPPLDWSGTLSVRQSLGAIAREGGPALFAPGAAGAAWLSTGDHRLMMGVGVVVGVVVMAYDRRRTRANRWSTT